MENFDMLKALGGLISAIGTVALYKFNSAQALRIRAELLEKLDSAITESKKHSTCEIFRMLHGLRVDFEDIRTICSHDKANKIILALQKTPGLVKHENGRLQYTKLYGNKWIRRTNRLITTISAILLGIVTGAMIILAASLEGSGSLAIIVFAIPFAALLTMQIKDVRHDIMVETLVPDSTTSTQCATERTRHY